MATTPDFEAAILTTLATLLPADIVTSPASARTAMAGPIRTQVDVGVPMVFVQASGGIPDLTNDGPRPTVNVTVLVRGPRSSYEAARALAFRIHDALHLSGRRVVGGATIVDVASLTAIPIYLGPGDDEAEYFSETFNVVSEVLS